MTFYLHGLVRVLFPSICPPQSPDSRPKLHGGPSPLDVLLGVVGVLGGGLSSRRLCPPHSSPTAAAPHRRDLIQPPDPGEVGRGEGRGLAAFAASGPSLFQVVGRN